MTEIQIISRILNNRSISILTINGINVDYFDTYKEEIEFILNHEKEYGNVPDKETFLSKFQDFDVLEVAEGDKYLVEKLNEEYNYLLTVDVINKAADLMQTNSHDAVDYIKSQLPKLSKTVMPIGVDIISSANERLEYWENIKEHKEEYLIPTGFEQLDDIIGGFSRSEELVVLFARTGQGKSWVMIKMLEHMWKMNYRIGLVEPEMSAIKTGYRFDTLHKNMSNSALTKGHELTKYNEYIESLKNKSVPFFVAHPRDFKRKITASKLKAFVEANQLDVLAIDGISYLTDERASRGDSRASQLTNISEDLMDLSIELGVPVIVVAQSNREGAKQSDLEIENIRDSDGISFNSSLIFSIQQKDPGLVLSIKKNRNGSNNRKLSYLWDIDKGEFTFVPTDEDDNITTENVRSKYKDVGETF